MDSRQTPRAPEVSVAARESPMVKEHPPPSTGFRAPAPPTPLSARYSAGNGSAGRPLRPVGQQPRTPQRFEGRLPLVDPPASVPLLVRAGGPSPGSPRPPVSPFQGHPFRPPRSPYPNPPISRGIPLQPGIRGISSVPSVGPQTINLAPTQTQRVQQSLPRNGDARPRIPREKPDSIGSEPASTASPVSRSPAYRDPKISGQNTPRPIPDTVVTPPTGADDASVNDRESTISREPVTTKTKRMENPTQSQAGALDESPRDGNLLESKDETPGGKSQPSPRAKVDEQSVENENEDDDDDVVVDKDGEDRSQSSARQNELPRESPVSRTNSAAEQRNATDSLKKDEEGRDSQHLAQEPLAVNSTAMIPGESQDRPASASKDSNSSPIPPSIDSSAIPSRSESRAGESRDGADRSDNEERSLSASPLVPPITSGSPLVPPTSPGLPLTPPKSPGSPHVPPTSPGLPLTPPKSPGSPRVPPASSGSPVVPPKSPGSPNVPPASSGSPDVPPKSPGSPHVPPTTSGSPVVPPKSPGPPHVPPTSSDSSPVPPKSPGPPHVPPTSSGSSPVPPKSPGSPLAPASPSSSPLIPSPSPGSPLVPPTSADRPAANDSPTTNLSVPARDSSSGRSSTSPTQSVGDASIEDKQRRSPSPKSPSRAVDPVESPAIKESIIPADVTKPEQVDRGRRSARATPSPTPVEQRARTPGTPDVGCETLSVGRSPSGRSIKSDAGASESGVDRTNRVSTPTTNGVSLSPTKRQASKTSSNGSPVKSPSKSVKSLPKTPEAAPPSTAEKKKVPMNKIQVGAAPSPNLKTVRSKIGSLDNASYKPGGGKVKIENRKLDFSKAQPKIAAKNDKYTPSGGEKKIPQVKLQWNAKPKVGSLDNATYKPGGGDKKIETVKLDFKDKAKPKVGSRDNAKHVPGGGTVKIETQKIDIRAESKVGSLDNVGHKPGGGDKKIFDDREYTRRTGSSVESQGGSEAQSPVPPNVIGNNKNAPPVSDENLNEEC